MEINTEMNKIFGEEMAKLFVSKISEEELLKTARGSWSRLNHTSDRYWDSKSDFQKMIDNRILELVKNKVDELLKTESYQTKIKEEAEDIIEEIKNETHKKLVENISDRLSGSITSPDHYLRNTIQTICMEAMQH